MFMDFRDQLPPPPWEPRPRRRTLTPRQRRTVELIVFFNVAMLLCAPLAGATVVEGVIALLR